jgi:hypothetical protein
MHATVVAALQFMKHAMGVVNETSGRHFPRQSYTILQRGPSKKVPKSKPLNTNRSNLVQQKIDDLRRRSSLSSPVCFKCGDSSHLAGACRNGTLYFICNSFGHKSFHCKQYKVKNSYPPPYLSSPPALVPDLNPVLSKN